MRKTRVKALLAQFIKERHRYPETTERVINEFRRYRKQKARKATDMSRFHRMPGAARDPVITLKDRLVRTITQNKTKWMTRAATPYTVKL